MCHTFTCCSRHTCICFFSAAETTFLKAIDNAVANDDKTSRKLAHSVITGPTGSGKSSLILRLLRRPLEKFSKSTGVIESVIIVDIDEVNPTTFHSAMAIGADNWQETNYEISLVKQIGQSSIAAPADTQPSADSKHTSADSKLSSSAEAKSSGECLKSKPKRNWRKYLTFGREKSKSASARNTVLFQQRLEHGPASVLAFSSESVLSVI